VLTHAESGFVYRGGFFLVLEGTRDGVLVSGGRGKRDVGKGGKFLGSWKGAMRPRLPGCISTERDACRGMPAYCSYGFCGWEVPRRCVGDCETLARRSVGLIDGLLRCCAGRLDRLVV
jgi:hypothetical protein